MLIVQGVIISTLPETQQFAIEKLVTIPKKETNVPTPTF